MKKIYQLLFALGAAATSLTSCSHGNYAGNQHTALPMSSPQAAPAATLADAETTARVLALAAPQDIIAVAPAPVNIADNQRASARSVASSKVVRANLAQRLLLKKATKQLAKIQAARQNTAEVEQTASRAGNAGLVMLVGAVILLIGGLIGGANVVATIGGVIFIVGLILLIIALINK